MNTEQFLREEGYNREEEQEGYILTVSEMIELLKKFRKRSVKPLLTAGWIDAAKKKPKCDREFNESDYLLCLANHTQFVGWYNSKLNEWFVGHFLAQTVPLSHDNIPTHWMPLPIPPDCR